MTGLLCSACNDNLAGALRVFVKEYLTVNPLGTIPLMIDGDTRMTESSGICQYLGTREREGS